MLFDIAVDVYTFLAARSILYTSSIRGATIDFEVLNAIEIYVKDLSIDGFWGEGALTFLSYILRDESRKKKVKEKSAKLLSYLISDRKKYYKYEERLLEEIRGKMKKASKEVSDIIKRYNFSRVPSNP